MTKTLGLVFLASMSLYADDWSKTWQATGSSVLHAESSDGSFHVRGWDGKTVEAHLTTHGWHISPSEVHVIEHQTGDRIDLEVKLPHRNGITIGRYSADVELRVPNGMEVEIRTGDGSITVEGLSNKTQLKTGDGRITAHQMAGSLEARTGDGHIEVSGVLSGLTLDSGDGSIEADLEAGSQMKGPWTVHSGDGSVHLKLPDNFRANLDARTNDGSVKVDVPLTVSGTQDHSSVQGKLNGGGQMLTVRTGDGSIQVAHR